MPENVTAPGEVILVHGLWYGAMAMKPLAMRLRECGHAVRLFSYNTTTGTLSGHADELARFAATEVSPEVHFVGHSLGGLVILKMFDGRARLRAGRIVLLGSPLQGSQAARSAMNLPGGSRILRTAGMALSEGFPHLPAGKEVGMVAGSRSVGLGRLLASGPGAGDGTVSLQEADSPQLTARVVLPVSHTGMLFSRKVSQHVAGFLARGSF